MQLHDAFTSYTTVTNRGTMVRSTTTRIPGHLPGIIELLPALADAENYRVSLENLTVESVEVSLSFILPGDGSYELKYTTVEGN